MPFSTKMKTHAEHDLVRDPSVPLAERQAAFDRTAELSGRLPHPPGVEEFGRNIRIPRPVQ